LKHPINSIANPGSIQPGPGHQHLHHALATVNACESYVCIYERGEQRNRRVADYTVKVFNCMHEHYCMVAMNV